MQNDIVKPPAQPTQPPNQEEVSVGNEVHSQPGLAEHPAPAKFSADAAPSSPSSQAAYPDTSSKTNAETPAEIKKPNNSKPIGAIVAAVVVFLGLASGAVYMTMQNKEDNKPTASSVQAPAATATTQTDTGADIDDTLNEASQLPTSNEDPANDLSDPSLGL